MDATLNLDYCDCCEGHNGHNTVGSDCGYSLDGIVWFKYCVLYVLTFQNSQLFGAIYLWGWKLKVNVTLNHYC